MEFKSFVNACLSERERLIGLLKNPSEQQKIIFNEIVRPNAHTVFGKSHRFDEIESIDSYRTNVPIRDYDQFAKWIEDCGDGKTDVLTAEPTFMFYSTSGTTGASKKIPATRSWITKYRMAAVRAAWGNLFHFYPEAATSADAVIDLHMDPRPANHFTKGGIPCQGGTSRSNPAGPGDWDPPWIDEPWFRTPAKMTEYRDRIFLKLLHFLEKDVRAIVTLNPSTLVAAAHNLDQRKHDLVHACQQDGRTNLVKKLERLMSENAILQPKHVWPNLRALMCWKSATATLYMSQLKEQFGKDIEIFPYLTVASEGTLATPVDQAEGAPLAITQCLFEFLPSHENSPVGNTFLYNELEAGQTYQIIISQTSGLYRYRLGDLVRVVAMEKNDVPRIEFLSRMGSGSSFTGEKLTEEQVLRAATVTCQKWGIELHHITCFPCWGDPPYYLFLVETKKGLEMKDINAIAKELDDQLGVRNEEYPSKRNSGRLGEVQVKIAAPGSFQKLWEFQVSGGVSAAQVKHRILHKDDSLLRNFFARE